MLFSFNQRYGRSKKYKMLHFLWRQLTPGLNSPVDFQSPLDSELSCGYPWRSTIPGGQLSQEVNYPWRSTIHEGQLSLDVNYPWRSTIPEGQLSMEVNYPWMSIIPGGRLSLEVNYPWFLGFYSRVYFLYHLNFWRYGKNHRYLNKL